MAMGHAYAFREIREYVLCFAALAVLQICVRADCWNSLHAMT